MKKEKAIERDFQIGRFLLFVTFFPYQIAFGFSIRYLSCFGGWMIRLYFGPFKFGVSIGREQANIGGNGDVDKSKGKAL